MKISQISTNSLLITFGEKISKDISKKVQNGFEAIRALNDQNIYEIIPSYTTIFLSYDIFVYDFIKIKEKLEKTIKEHKTQTKIDKNDIIHIDVCYDISLGFDLKYLSKEKNISIEEIIQIHSQKVYDVYAIGFLPGFAFLGLVDESIATARLSTPRKKVPKGSVGIADNQTAVYPQDSAGGWNIIGQTKMELFDKDMENLSPFGIGKKVKFDIITKDEFDKL